jgi:hypothetical protein
MSSPKPICSRISLMFADSLGVFLVEVLHRITDRLPAQDPPDRVLEGQELPLASGHKGISPGPFDMTDNRQAATLGVRQQPLWQRGHERLFRHDGRGSPGVCRNESVCGVPAP